MDWDDLRFFLAVARAGSLSRAARELSVNHSTVSRRLNAFESSLDVRLFERSASGYSLTAAGEELMETAARMEHEVAAVDRRLLSRDPRLTGTLRVALADFGAPMIVPDLAAFAAAYPGIELEMVADNAFANLTRREADVAVRGTNDPPQHLVGRRVAFMSMAIYASTGYLERHGDLPDLDAHTWVGWDESVRQLRSAIWIRQNVKPERVASRVNSAFVMHEAVKAGLGVGFLYCFRADPDPELRRVQPVERDFDVALWLLTHEDLRRSARVRAFLDFMAERFAAHRDLLEGRRGRVAG
jgi:DNA-binding transcriptional LysR family regulator